MLVAARSQGHWNSRSYGDAAVSAESVQVHDALILTDGAWLSPRFRPEDPDNSVSLLEIIAPRLRVRERLPLVLGRRMQRHSGVARTPWRKAQSRVVG